MGRQIIPFIINGLLYPVTARGNQRSAHLIAAITQSGDVSLSVIALPPPKPFLKRAGYQVAAAAKPEARRQSIIGRVLKHFTLEAVRNSVRQSLQGSLGGMNP